MKMRIEQKMRKYISKMRRGMVETQKTGKTKKKAVTKKSSTSSSTSKKSVSFSLLYFLIAYLSLKHFRQ
jgi:hypothetical protein